MGGQLYLVDGMSHIYRAYYAIKGLINKKGLPTNAVYGFTNMLRKLIKEESPQYLGVAIDLFGPTVRHEQYEAYKATRRPTPQDLIDQIPYVLKVCDVLRVPVLSYQKYEADDVIGTLALKACNRGLEVVIVTIDKDMFQLVNDRVTILDTRSMLRLDRGQVEGKFGAPPEKVVDVLSLVGDSSDNIPGAPGIGAKGARQLIAEFGSLEELLAKSDQVRRKTYRESLQHHREQILQSRELVRIHVDLPLELNLAELERSDPDREGARKLFIELDFLSLLEEFLPQDRDSEIEYESIDQLNQLAELRGVLEGETAGLAIAFPAQGELEGQAGGAAVSPGPSRAWSLEGGFLQAHPAQAEAFFAAPSLWAIHDLKPLCLLGGGLGWEPDDRCRDTMLMAYLLDPNQNDFSLQKLVREHLHYRLEAGDGAGNLFDEGGKKRLAERAELTLRLFRELSPKVEELGLEPLLSEIEMPLVSVLANMEQTGVKVDCVFLQQLSAEMEGEISRLREQIHAAAGEPFNINSPRQLADILFQKLRLPVIKKTRKAGHYATGVEVLEVLAEDHEIARLILDYRELTKLKNTYLDALPRLVNPQTGRIHTSYNQMVAATGRLSSSNPNLQNIPIKGQHGRRIRRAFIAEPGFQLLSADYSQIELRVMAHLSGDPVLIEAFHRGEDIHERTAREVFGMRAVMEPRQFRRHAKVINFGIMYGLSAFGLAQSLKIDRKEAQEFIDAYFTRYQGVKDWIDKTLQEVREKGYVKTMLGRIRPVPEIHSKNWNVRNFGERTAINAPIQGTAADLIKKAMVSIQREIERRRLRSRLIMQVHDELVLEVEESEVEVMKSLVAGKMEGVLPLLVPLEVDLAVGSSWLEAK
ncbi:MAG: DNA polymerase I [Acidobacteriota bacterium]